MEQMINAVMRAITAAANFFVGGASFALSNPWFLGLTVIMLLSAGKSMRIGKLFSVKG